MVEADTHETSMRRAASMSRSIPVTDRLPFLDQTFAGFDCGSGMSASASLVVATMSRPTSARSIAARQSSARRPWSCQCFRARAFDVSACHQTGAAERCRAFPSDQAAADNGDAGIHLSPQSSPRSAGITRRSV
jgi:hypothetical protein